jgi:hypothetical protein
MTLSPICSTVNPSTGSYRDRPIAWICSVLFIVSARRNVRYITMELVISSYQNYQLTITRAGKNPLNKDICQISVRMREDSVITNPPPKQMIISTGLITAETKTDRLQLTNRD